MPSDHDPILVTARCSKCARPVAAPLAELRQTGVFGCVCGTLTRARYEQPESGTLFAGAGWT